MRGTTPPAALLPPPGLRPVINPYLRLELALQEKRGAGRAIGGTTGNGHRVSSPLLRRVLGKALIDRFCPFGKPVCEEKPSPPLRPSASPQERCDLAESCPYGVLFAASRTRRPPYALYVPLSGPEAVCVEVTLYGAAWCLYPWVVAAAAQALDGGLGKARQQWRIAEVRRIHPDGPPERLAGGEVSTLPSSLPPDLLDLAVESPLTEQPVVVELLSPTRLLRDGRLLPGRQPVPFAVLIARILDRFAGLYGENSSDLLRPDLRATIETQAARIRLLDDSTRWIEVRDYSARSGTEMLLGGKVGRLLYDGEAARFLPILRAGEILHVGKNTASGCGRIRVDLLSV